MTTLARQAHPFTTGAVALALATLGVLAPAPGGTAMLYVGIVMLALLTGGARGVWLALVISGPLWVLLFVMHGILGEGPRVPFIGGGHSPPRGLSGPSGRGRGWGRSSPPRWRSR